MHQARQAITILAAASCAACSSLDGPVVYNDYYGSGYTPSHVALAASSGDTLARIGNDPFPQDRDGAGVLAAMQGANPGPKLHFTQVPRPDDKYGYMVVLIFDGPVLGGYGATCQTAQPTYRPPADEAPPQASSQPTASRPRNIEVTGYFCVGDVELSRASAAASGITGADDPKFRRLVADLMSALLPPVIPDRHQHRSPGMVTVGQAGP